jgi:hypothetical protein
MDTRKIGLFWPPEACTAPSDNEIGPRLVWLVPQQARPFQPHLVHCSA